MTSAPRWKARPDGPEYGQVRARLVDAAEEIVRDQGVQALRLETVAERAGLHRSSVYRYVDSKEELLTAVVVQATLRVRRTVLRRLGPSAPPERLLGEGLAIALTELVHDPVHRSLMAPAASDAMARISGRALSEALRPLIDPLFAMAAEQDLLRPDVTLDEASLWLQVVATGLLRSADLLPPPPELAAVLERRLVPVLFRSAGDDAAGRQRARSAPS